MKKYKIRPGVVLASVCGEYILVSSAAARENCPYMTQLNETSAFLWEQMKDGVTIEQLQDAVFSAYEVDNNTDVYGVIRDFLDQLCNAGYLTVEQEKNNES